MSDFLTDLEAQLVGAHPRRKAARRRATAGRVLREAPLALLLVLVLGGAVAFVTQVGSGDPGTVPADGTAPAPAAGSEPTFTVTDPPLPAGGLVVLNASDRPGVARSFASVVALRRAVAAVGTAPEPVGRSVVAYRSGEGARARTVANGLGLDIRLLGDEESVAARRAGVAVLVGQDVLAAEVRTLRTPGGTITGRVGQIQRVGEGRLISVATRQADRTRVELRPCPGGQPRMCQIGVFGPGARDGFVSFGVRLEGRTVTLRRDGRQVASARLSTTEPRAVRPQAVSVLDTVARQPRGGRPLTSLLQRETTTARYASTPPAIAGVDVQYAPGAEAVASRIARRFGVRPRQFANQLTRAQAGGEAGVALRLGKAFLGARLVRLGSSTVSVVRYGRVETRSEQFEKFCAANPGACDEPQGSDRRVVTAEIDVPRGSVVTFERAGRVVQQATNTGEGVDVAFTLGTASAEPLAVKVDGRRIGLVPLD